MTKEEMLEKANSFAVGNWNGAVHVNLALRDSERGLWAIVRGDSGSVWNTYGEWEFEPSPSSRDDEFFARCRYTLDQAMKIVGWNK